MAGWHHWLDGRESEWTPGVGDGQGVLACRDSWGHKELDMTEWLNWTDICFNYGFFNWLHFSLLSWFLFFFSFSISSLCECVSFFGCFCLWSTAITICLRILSVHPFFVCTFVWLAFFLLPSLLCCMPCGVQSYSKELGLNFWSRRTEFRTLDQRTPEPIDHQLVRVLQKASNSTLRLGTT